jgi:hypothetical protein
MPPAPRTGGSPVTNIRNTSSLHWRSIWIARGLAGISRLNANQSV